MPLRCLACSSSIGRRRAILPGPPCCTKLRLIRASPQNGSRSPPAFMPPHSGLGQGVGLWAVATTGWISETMLCLRCCPQSGQRGRVRDRHFRFSMKERTWDQKLAFHSRCLCSTLERTRPRPQGWFRGESLLRWLVLWSWLPLDPDVQDGRGIDGGSTMRQRYRVHRSSALSRPGGGSLVEGAFQVLGEHTMRTHLLSAEISSSACHASTRSSD